MITHISKTPQQKSAEKFFRHPWLLRCGTLDFLRLPQMGKYSLFPCIKTFFSHVKILSPLIAWEAVKSKDCLQTTLSLWLCSCMETLLSFSFHIKLNCDFLLFRLDRITSVFRIENPAHCSCLATKFIDKYWCFCPSGPSSRVSLATHSPEGPNQQ